MPTDFDVNFKILKIQRDGEERAAKQRADHLKLPYVDLRKTTISLEAVRVILEADARAAQMVGIQIRLHDLAIALVDPSLPDVTRVLNSLHAADYKTRIFICSKSSLAEGLRLYEFVATPHKEIVGTLEITEDHLSDLKARAGSFVLLQKSLADINYETLSTTDFFQLIIIGALSSRASDIHLEAGDVFSKIRFRIDGILHDVAANIPAKGYDHLLSRLKLLSELKINVRDEPQDGRYTITISKKEMEVRVSIIPSEYGETVVMRILDPAAISVGLPDLGLRADDLALVEAQLKRPNGLILNTGPTGSGKTTTLYAFLRHIVNPEIKVITVEDPIEYRLDGVEQTQVDPEANYTFASGLRSILRQDPDAILVGEIRDQETADIALQAALTGHLVFSTLHTNDAVGAVPRLVDLGVKTATIGPALSLIIAQRLVRKLCIRCRKTIPISKELVPKITSFINNLPARVDRSPYHDFIAGGGQICEPGGCEECNSFGYRGRIGIFEFLQTAYPEFEEAILNSSSEITLRKLAKSQDMVTMQQDGVLKVLRGETNFEEVESVTGPINW